MSKMRSATVRCPAVSGTGPMRRRCRAGATTGQVHRRDSSASNRHRPGEARIHRARGEATHSAPERSTRLRRPCRRARSVTQCHPAPDRQSRVLEQLRRDQDRRHSDHSPEGCFLKPSARSRADRGLAGIRHAMYAASHSQLTAPNLHVPNRLRPARTCNPTRLGVSRRRGPEPVVPTRWSRSSGPFQSTSGMALIISGALHASALTARRSSPAKRLPGRVPLRARRETWWSYGRRRC